MKKRVFVCSCDTIVIVKDDDEANDILCPVCHDGTAMNCYVAKEGNSSLNTALINLDVTIHDHCEHKRGA